MPDYVRLPTRSIGLKFLLVCFLALVMAVPIGFVWAVSADREHRFNSVRADLAEEEGGQQTILGPVLIVPYDKDVRGEDGKVVTIRDEAIAFAETGAADARLETFARKRGIYTVPTYTSITDVKADFDPAAMAAELTELDKSARYDWASARIVMGVSGAKGFRSDVTLDLGEGRTRAFKPVAGGVPSGAYDNGGRGDAYYPGVSLIGAQVGDFIADRKPFTASARVELSGAERFAIASFAKDTTAHVAAPWPDPSFEGGFLPDERTITAQGFDAQWRAPLVRRGVAPAALNVGALGQVVGKDFAVRFVEPTNVYTGVDRALKYSMMFIGLVFLTYFLFEVVTGGKAHPAQYLMVGLSQAIFYLLLLAFAERLGFTIAFVIAAAATIVMISLYVGTVFKKRAYVAPAFLVFLGVYALMYVLMQQEDYALLIGAVMSFTALAALMYLTRNVAWYGGDEARGAPPGPPPAAPS